MNEVVHLGKFYNPVKGGIELVTEKTAEIATDFLYSVTVITFDSLNSVDIVNNVTVIRSKIDFTIVTQPVSFRYIFNSIKYGFKADIIHAHAPNLLILLAAIFFRKKMIVHWHSDVHKEGAIGKIANYIQELIAKSCKVIICTSYQYARSSPVIKKFLGKVEVIPLTVTDFNFNNIKNKSKDNLPFEIKKFVGSRKIVLSVGRLVEFKGIEFLIKAMKSLDGTYALLIVGNGNDLKRLKKITDDLELNNKILFVGEVPFREKLNLLDILYKNSDVFCLPSVTRAESFGLVLIEAMASGLPCVVSDLPDSGISWVNQNGETGYNVSAKDPEAIAHAIHKICNDGKYDEFSKNSRNRYETFFNEKTYAHKIINLYTTFESL